MSKHMKISIEMGHDKEDQMEQEAGPMSPDEAQEILKKAKAIKSDKALMQAIKSMPKKPKVGSISDLRKLAEKPNFGIGEKMDDGSETSDDKAEKEDRESRVKNSKNPTIVGKVMK